MAGEALPSRAKLCQAAELLSLPLGFGIHPYASSAVHQTACLSTCWSSRFSCRHRDGKEEIQWHFERNCYLLQKGGEHYLLSVLMLSYPPEIGFFSVFMNKAVGTFLPLPKVNFYFHVACARTWKGPNVVGIPHEVSCESFCLCHTI